jgi:hypothetical protein
MSTVDFELGDRKKGMAGYENVRPYISHDGVVDDQA